MFRREFPLHCSGLVRFQQKPKGKPELGVIKEPLQSDDCCAVGVLYVVV